jgi:RNA polymerase sigma factor (sigma-70 family)
MNDEFIPTRQSLITRLKHWDDQEGWQRFFDTYGRMLYSIARRSGLTDADAQDVVQETILAVAKQMPQFKYDSKIGSFKGWLAQLTRRRIIDLLRKRCYQSKGQQFAKEETLDTAIAEHEPDRAAANLERVWEDEWNKQVMETALEKAKRTVSAAHYQIFHLHVIKNVPAKEVAQLLQVELPEVYYAKKKITEILQDEIHRLEQKMI